MEFIVEGATVNCVRVLSGEGSGRVQRQTVTSFDAHLDAVAPHVAAALTSDEVGQLEKWLGERANLRSREANHTLLESIPELLSQAESVVLKEGALNERLLQRLRVAAIRFHDTLAQAQSTPQGDSPVVERMDTGEVLKQQLDIVRKDL